MGKLFEKIKDLERNIEHLTKQKYSLEQECKFPISLWYKTISKLNDIIKSISKEEHSIDKVRELFLKIKDLENEMEKIIENEKKK